MNDTIVAIATPVGESAIGVIRISGRDSFKILENVFKSKDKISFSDKPEVIYGKIVDGEKIIDEVLVTAFKSPKSYTGEDLVEISCHGNPFILKCILNLLVSKGARLANPGEFTERAYLNGKMDLLKAEAVNDIIKAHTKYSHLASVSQLTGRLKEKLTELLDYNIEILALIEASIDHSDIEETFLPPERLKEMLYKLKDMISELLSTAKSGKISVSGLKVAIIGAPNTGKSSLMNALLNEDRVIVSEVAGTTRDVITDEISVRGISVKLFDTAGIRNSLDIVEKLGIERTEKVIEEADLIFFLLDGSRMIMEDDLKIFEKIKNKDFVVVINKDDLPEIIDEVQVEEITGKKPIKISTLRKTDIKKVEDEIEKYYFSLGYSPENDVLITNVRQESLLKESLKSVERAINGLLSNLSEEFIASDLRNSKYYIEKIIGLSKDEAILDKIFSKFCIGK